MQAEMSDQFYVAMVASLTTTLSQAFEILNQVEAQRDEAQAVLAETRKQRDEAQAELAEAQKELQAELAEAQKELGRKRRRLSDA